MCLVLSKSICTELFHSLTDIQFYNFPFFILVILENYRTLSYIRMYVILHGIEKEREERGEKQGQGQEKKERGEGENL